MKEIEKNNTDVNPIEIKKGIPYGLVWGILLFSSFVYLFFFIGIYFFWNNKDINSIVDFLFLVLGSAGYLTISGILFFIVIISSIYLIWKDTNFRQSIHKNWPVILAFLYPFIPNLPGPWDEGILAVVMFIIRMVIFFKTGKSVENKKIPK